MSYNAKNFPEKFEEDEDSKVGDDEDDDDDEADTTNEKVPEKLTKGAVNAVKELPGKKKLVDAPPEDGHHRSMQDQLANFHKGWVLESVMVAVGRVIYTILLKC